MKEGTLMISEWEFRCKLAEEYALDLRARTYRMMVIIAGLCLLAGGFLVEIVLVIFR